MEKLLRVPAVAERLSLSRAKTYELLASGQLPSVTVGRARRVRESDLDTMVRRWAAEQVTETPTAGRER